MIDSYMFIYSFTNYTTNQNPLYRVFLSFVPTVSNTCAANMMARSLQFTIINRLLLQKVKEKSYSFNTILNYLRIHIESKFGRLEHSMPVLVSLFRRFQLLIFLFEKSYYEVRCSKVKSFIQLHIYFYITEMWINNAINISQSEILFYITHV